MVMKRRQLLGGFAVVTGSTALGLIGFLGRNSQTEAGTAFEIVRSDEEWRRRLASAQYRVLREHGTERAGSSPLDREKRPGTFHCAGCDLALFSSDTKFDSGTGWPSFWAPLDNAIGTSEDHTLFVRRTEVHCRRCGGHLGHVFEDGPKPTGLRYCINGVALSFVPAAAAGRAS
ncbi:MAG: peptide-methionine (R)-S-oxide reductase MsrB [Alphaproteobacteria bacterium]|nr:peptide-methionine (R)-S-oxide reductase MsrB [Alphaproteobacteria bacterium]